MLCKDKAGPAAGEKRNLLFYFSKDQPPKKRASGQTEQQQTGRQTENHQEQQWPELGPKSRALWGAATYRCILKNEWTTTWPFITKGSLITHYWCSVCRVENACCHQGVTDVVAHIKSKSHQEKQRTLQSTATIDRFSVSTPSVGGMSDQEAKVCYVSWSCQGSRVKEFCVMYCTVMVDSFD